MLIKFKLYKIQNALF